MPHHIGGGESADRHALHALQHLGRLDQAAQLLLAQFELGLQPGALASSEMQGHRVGTSGADDAQSRCIAG